MLLDLIGDIEIDAPNMRNKTNGLRFIQELMVTEGRFGSDAWWIPFTYNIGLKIMHTRRYPKDQATTFRTDDAEKANDYSVWLANNWYTYIKEIRAGKRFLPQIYGHLVIRHTGKYELGMTKKRQKGYDEGMFYPAWLMKIYPQIIDFKDGEKEDYVTCCVADHMAWAAGGLIAKAGWGRDEMGRLIRIDIDNESGGKCA